MFLIQTLVKLRKKVLINKYVTTQDCNKLAAESFTARLKQANLVSKTNFDNKLINVNEKITSNETKYLEVKKAKYSNNKRLYFFSGRIYFISNDRS